MPRGELWLPEELKVLFKVVQDSCDLDILMSSRHANAVEWEPISLKMSRFGFRRTWQQCRAKWKALRRAFHLENEHKLRHGTHTDKRPPSYSIMLKLWQKAGRPVFRDQHMLRNRSRHLSLSCSGLGRRAFYSHALSGVRQYLSGGRGGIPRIASLSLAVNPEGKVEEDEVESLRLGCDAVLPASCGDSMSVLCAGLGRGVLEEEEDVKPKILHPLQETLRSDGEPAAADKCQELQLLEQLVMQQKEIITRLDYLNYNLVQMASLHYQHLVESSPDLLKMGRQDPASSGDPCVAFPSMIIPFPSSVPPESAYMTYISTSCPPAPCMPCSKSPPSSKQSFHPPAACTLSSQPGATYVPSSHPATSYVSSSQLLSSLYVAPITSSVSPPASAGHPSTVSTEEKHSAKTP